jgi:serine/threonine-protein kinase
MAAAQGAAPPVDFVAPPPSSTTTTVPAEQTTLPGNAQLPVPDVRGRSFDEAAGLIQKAGFAPARFDVVDGSVPAGSVSAQSPPGGSTSPPGARVTLEVAVSPNDAVTVPNVFGMKKNAAMNALHDAGLVAQVTEEQSPDNTQDQGRVWKQSPPAGAMVSAGTTVTIFVNPG